MFGVAVLKASMLDHQGVDLLGSVWWYSRHLCSIAKGFRSTSASAQVWCSGIQGICA